MCLHTLLLVGLSEVVCFAAASFSFIVSYILILSLEYSLKQTDLDPYPGKPKESGAVPWPKRTRIEGPLNNEASGT